MSPQVLDERSAAPLVILDFGVMEVRGVLLYLMVREMKEPAIAATRTMKLTSDNTRHPT
jgi:hypothetical protein